MARASAAYGRRMDSRIHQIIVQAAIARDVQVAADARAAGAVRSDGPWARLTGAHVASRRGHRRLTLTARSTP